MKRKLEAMEIKDYIRYEVKDDKMYLFDDKGKNLNNSFFEEFFDEGFQPVYEGIEVEDCSTLAKAIGSATFKKEARSSAKRIIAEILKRNRG